MKLAALGALFCLPFARGGLSDDINSTSGGVIVLPQCTMFPQIPKFLKHTKDKINQGLIFMSEPLHNIDNYTSLMIWNKSETRFHLLAISFAETR
jgi:hypothetical protein